MLAKFKNLIRRVVLGYDISNYFFASSGEDAILQAIFHRKLTQHSPGFFVDVGAYHPYKSSNTYLLYINGWTGINIEACPGSKAMFDKYRPNDINLEIGVGAKESTATYYLINEGSLQNSFSKEFLIQTGMYSYVTREVPVKIKPLRQIFDEYAAKCSSIDLLTIDVEGFDLEVVQSNDWNKYRPKVVLVELECHTLEDVSQNQTAKFLMNLGYEIVAKNFIIKSIATVFFVDTNFEY